MSPGPEVPPAPVKVLFMAGKGRSGGTLLAGLLGQLPGFFNVGELNRLWDWRLAFNYRCGCGRPVRECPTWREILAEADTLVGNDSARSEGPLGPGPALADAGVDRAQAAVVRWPNLPRLLAARRATIGRWPELERYTDASAAVYRSISRITGARVVVDSSRLPFEPVALGLVPGVDVRLVQLIRDPRAVVYSWKRSRAMTDREPGEYMPRYSAAFTTTSWDARNIVVELLRRRSPTMTVQYDELARDPSAVLRRLAEFVDEPAGDLGFLRSNTATLTPTHSVGGNPVRMESGEIAITPDEEWRAGLGRADRLVATTLALPLLHRYGLPVRVHR